MQRSSGCGKKIGISVLVIFGLFVSIIVLALCSSDGISNGRASDTSNDRIVGTWHCYGASTSATGSVREEDLSSAFIKFLANGSFDSDGVWESYAGSWSRSGNTYHLDFISGDSRRVVYQNGRIYTNINGIYFWFR